VTRQSRREFVKKAAYIPPVILSLAATPSYAKTGSRKDDTPPGRERTPPGHNGTPPGYGGMPPSRFGK
jgi:hypothetical protein